MRSLTQAAYHLPLAPPAHRALPGAACHESNSTARAEATVGDREWNPDVIEKTPVTGKDPLSWDVDGVPVSALTDGSGSFVVRA